MDPITISLLMSGLSAAEQNKDKQNQALAGTKPVNFGVLSQDKPGFASQGGGQSLSGFARMATSPEALKLLEKLKTPVGSGIDASSAASLFA